MFNRSALYRSIIVLYNVLSYNIDASINRYIYNKKSKYARAYSVFNIAILFGR